MTRRLLMPSKRLFVPKKPALLRIWDEEALEYSEGGGGLISSMAPVPMSLVLTAASSQFLSRTWGIAPTSVGSTTFTLSFWFKRAALGGTNCIHDGGNWTTDAEAQTRFSASFNADNLQYDLYDNATTTVFCNEGTNAQFQDAAWHHACVGFDSTNGTGVNRRAISVDNVALSSALNPDVIPALNQNMHFADNAVASAIGRNQRGATNYFDGKLAYFYLIDGQQLSASNFVSGSGAGTTHPILYAGTFGNNGFFLDFRNSNTNDQSGVNSNNWTQNNGPTFSTDVPT